VAARKLYAATATEADRGLLDETALPILYLARHAVELALKSLIEAHDSNERDRALIDAHAHVMASPCHTEADLKDLSKSHSLRYLLGLVRKCLGAHVTPEWERLIEAICVLEDGADERFRFGQVWRPTAPGAKARRELVPSFPQPVVVAVAPILEQLDRFISEAARPTDLKACDSSTPESALAELYMEAQDLAQQMYTRGLLDGDPA
jgi:hypothetical protein